MADYPLAAVASVAFANLLMAIVFGVLHARERRPGLLWFALAWTLESVRHLFSLIEADVIVFFAGGFAFALAVFTLVEGSFRFAARRPSVLVRASFVLLVAWQVAVFLWEPPFILWHLPVSIFTAAMRGLVAFMLWRAGGPWLGRSVATFSMGLWSLHALSYPFLANVPSAAPWGFAISASLGLLTAVGVVMAYFERAREAADASEAGLRAVFEGASDGIATLDGHGRVLTANPALARLLGYDDPSELEGESLAALVGRERGDFTAPPSGAVESWRRKDGDVRLVATSVSGTRSGDRVDVFVRDVTERTRLQQALEETRRLEALGRLAGGVAHDFNNLLQIISASLEIAMRPAHDARGTEHVAIALDAAARGAQLTRQLLTFGRKQVAPPRHVDVAGVARELGGWVPRLLGDHVTLELDVPVLPLVVSADRVQLEQMLLNLVTNARDAMPKGGRVLVSVQMRGERVVIEVNDQGVGMDEDTRTRIFEPFFTTKERGTGLGLATVHGIAAQHGWELTVASAPGEGSTFRVEIPLAAGATESVEQPLDVPDETSRARVVLVEDDETLRSLFTSLLGEAGYDVRSLTPGEAGGGLETCDVLVTDVQLAGASGPELAARARERDPRVGVVFVSGYAPESLGSLDPRTAFLPKPFRADELCAAVERVLAAR